MNKLILIGNLGKDPELRYTPQGDAVANFSICINSKQKDKSGELVETPTWFRVTLWRKQAENAAKYLTKGSSVYVEGRLSVEEWVDRDSKNRYTLNVAATDMHFIGGKKDSSDGEYSGVLAPSTAKVDDGIPW